MCICVSESVQGGGGGIGVEGHTLRAMGVCVCVRACLCVRECISAFECVRAPVLVSTVVCRVCVTLHAWLSGTLHQGMRKS